MSVQAATSRLAAPLPGWLPAVLLLIGTALAGSVAGPLARPAFVLGCGAVGWWAWRKSPADHLITALLLFSFAPFVRRLVDVSAGYDAAGIMLIGPLLALLAPLPRLVVLLETDRPLDQKLVPVLMVGGAVVYAALLSVLQADWFNAASGALKWGVPLLYAAVLTVTAERDAMLRAASGAFLVILPLTGLYGIYQYVAPPAWDQYWMSFAPIMSAGEPVPFGVRVFSTLNGPASFATFTAAGLLLVLFLRKGPLPLLLAAPAALGLLLSLYRTAWLSLAVGVLFCLLFAASRRRALLILIALVIALVIATMLPPFSEVIAERIATLGDGAGDGSAQERLEQFVILWSQWDSSLFGTGFTVTDVGSAGAMAIDGQIVACWLMMGIVGGLVCLTGFLWAIGNAVAAAIRDASAGAVVLGALACGALVQMPLASISSGELGVLFWTFAALAVARPDTSPRLSR
ncbi:hypothetical protein A33M_3114 [Rhodovulum sp. PH10]|uniref:O-antigen ligase family protein n=1 Tax=Rhodovulum sp. PH10 TaxID=1187851 RepID=UPI00027C203F|nr:O-antigen ligase family protein [Rhodovulum sp. PH10]EJW11501.1 hypothetical protein A33M_3114 [Rhodovulum sp. PH10]